MLGCPKKAGFKSLSVLLLFVGLLVLTCRGAQKSSWWMSNSILEQEQIHTVDALLLLLKISFLLFSLAGMCLCGYVHAGTGVCSSQRCWIPLELVAQEGVILPVWMPSVGAGNGSNL